MRKNDSNTFLKGAILGVITNALVVVTQANEVTEASSKVTDVSTKGVSFASSQGTPSSQDTPSPSQFPVASSCAQVVQQVLPSVVSISAISEHEVLSPFGNDPFFGLFFGPQSFTSRSSGSGVIVDPRGYIVTCAHVVEHARSVKVTLASGRTLKAETVLVDETLDLAVLRVDSKVALSSVPLLEGIPSVGDSVAAIGNAFGVGLTVTHGIISAGYRVFGGKVVVQTDAPINPGNSGGPILTLDGKIVGIASAIASKTGASHGVGFLIPALAVRQILSRAISGSKVARIPAKVQTLDPSIVEALNERGARAMGGCVVSTVWAPESGLKPGDVVLRVAGQEVHNQQMFEFFCQMIPVGESYQMTVVRAGDLVGDGEVVPTMLMMKAQAQTLITEIPGTMVLKGSHPLNEVMVANLTSEVEANLNWERRKRGVQKGVVVIETKGRNQFVKKGDVILQVNGYEIHSVTDLEEVLSQREKRGERGFSISVLRGDAVLQQSRY